MVRSLAGTGAAMQYYHACMESLQNMKPLAAVDQKMKDMLELDCVLGLLTTWCAHAAVFHNSCSHLSYLMQPSFITHSLEPSFITHAAIFHKR